VPQAEEGEKEGDKAMTVKNARRKQPDTYFDLVKEFPLTRIRDDDQLDGALNMVRRLMQEDLDLGERAYLDVLADLVKAYEDKHHPIPDASEADVLRLLMESNKLSQLKLAKMTGISQSTISAVLNGNRFLTKAQVVSLARVFGVSPNAFLPTENHQRARK
jgi:HTH-type transcriptional regulator/antitoxin HigA